MDTGQYVVILYVQHYRRPMFVFVAKPMYTTFTFYLFIVIYYCYKSCVNFNQTNMNEHLYSHILTFLNVMLMLYEFLNVMNAMSNPWKYYFEFWICVSHLSVVPIINQAAPSSISNVSHPELNNLNWVTLLKIKITQF